MGHTKAEGLEDLKSALSQIGSLEGLRERSPGVFYYKGSAFLHFHDELGRRWADVKTGRGWTRVEIGFGVTAAEREGFVKRIQALHAEIASRKGKR